MLPDGNLIFTHLTLGSPLYPFGQEHCALWSIDLQSAIIPQALTCEHGLRQKPREHVKSGLQSESSLHFPAKGYS